MDKMSFLDRKDFMDEVCKRKMTAQELYLLALRQMLLNQRQMLVDQYCFGPGRELAEDTEKLAARIMDFLKNKE
jgi:hypothetical protein